MEEQVKVERGITDSGYVEGGGEGQLRGLAGWQQPYEVRHTFLLVLSRVVQIVYKERKCSLLTFYIYEESGNR